jgi:hypothetical protein
MQRSVIQMLNLVAKVAVLRDVSRRRATAWFQSLASDAGVFILRYMHCIVWVSLRVSPPSVQPSGIDPQVGQEFHSQVQSTPTFLRTSQAKNLHAFVSNTSGTVPKVLEMLLF